MECDLYNLIDNIDKVNKIPDEILFNALNLLLKLFNKYTNFNT